MNLPPQATHFTRLRRVVLLLAIAAYLLSYFHRVAPAAIAQDLARDFHTSAASLGVLAATYFYVYTLMQIPTGVLADTLGPRKILTLGGIVAGLGSLLFGMAPSFEVALIGRTLVGLGVSVIFIAMLKLIAVWYEPQRFATITGIAMFLGNSGSVVAGAPLAWAAQATGWRSVFIVVGLLSLAIGIASWFLVRDQPNNSESVAEVSPTPPKHHWRTELMRVVKNRATWPGTLVNFGIGGSFFSFAGLWAVPYLTQGLGFTRAIASNHISFYFIGFAIGAMLIGRLSDAMGQRKPLLITGATLYTLSWLIWIFGGVQTPALTYSLFGLMGVCTACFTLTWSCAKEVNPPALSGMATSIVNAGMFLGGAMLQPLGGWVMDHTWNGTMENGVRLYLMSDYRACLFLHFGAAILGLAATFFVRETSCRNIWQELPRQ